MPEKLFTYFGNKQRIAPKIWELFGETKAYAEPFAGCASVLLSCPIDIKHTFEVLNDYDCHIANVFRSVKYHSEEVIEAAYGPRTEADLHTRHDWLIMHAEALRQHILSDPKACDPELAGWWIWGINLWIGDGWCSEAALKWKQKPVARNQGILSLKQKPVAGNRGILQKGDRRDTIASKINAVRDRLIDVTVCYGDFERVLTPSYTTKFGTCAVLLDPPYNKSKHNKDMKYVIQEDDVWGRTKKWFIDNKNNPLYRIILCGNSCDWVDPSDDVRVIKYKRRSGYAANPDSEEAFWLSPHCILTKEF